MNINKLDTEYEATFYNINVNEIREKIKKLNGKLLKPKFQQKRTIFNLPKGHEIKGAWLRVRDEVDRITLSLKIIKTDNSIDSQKEIELTVDSYVNAIKLLKTMGAKEKAVQETKRELWEIDNVKIMIDWWPFLQPIIEIEGKNEAEVKKIAEKLGFKWKNAIFNSVDYIYSQEYNISIDKINNHTPILQFNMKNPFVNH